MAMTFVYMWGQKPLYPGQTRYQIITGVAGGMRPELRTGPPISSGKRGFRSFPPSLAKLLQEMWHHDPASRPSASDVVHALEAMKAYVLISLASALLHSGREAHPCVCLLVAPALTSLAILFASARQ